MQAKRSLIGPCRLCCRLCRWNRLLLRRRGGIIPGPEQPVQPGEESLPSLGVALLGAYLVSWALCIEFIGFLLAPAVWITSMVMANNDAQTWNRAHGILS